MTQTLEQRVAALELQKSDRQSFLKMLVEEIQRGLTLDFPVTIKLGDGKVSISQSKTRSSSIVFEETCI